MGLQQLEESWQHVLAVHKQLIPFPKEVTRLHQLNHKNWFMRHVPMVFPDVHLKCTQLSGWYWQRAYNLSTQTFTLLLRLKV